MDGDIELDDIKVVSVTGKAYRDKPRTASEKESKCWSPSLRLKIILILVAFGILYVLGGVLVVVAMKSSLEELDKEALNTSINRFILLLTDDVVKMQPYAKHAAWQNLTAQAIEETKRNITNGPALTEFIRRYLNTSIVYHDDGTSEHVYRCDSLVNYWAFIDPVSFATLWHDYHPGNDEVFCTLNSVPLSVPAPTFPDSYLKSLIFPENDTREGWRSIFAPLIYGRGPPTNSDPMVVAIEAIMIPDETGNITDGKVYGYLLAAKTIKHYMSTFASNVPGCISMISVASDEQFFSEEDTENWGTETGENETHYLPPTYGTFTQDTKIFTGQPLFVKRDREKFDGCRTRFCPAKKLFDETEQLMTGYFVFCGRDPKTMGTTKNTCIRYRMDRPLSRIEEGTSPVIMLSVLIIVLTVGIFVLFIVFLDVVVLRRVVNLSNTIRKQTVEQRDLFKDVDERAAHAEKKKDKKGKLFDENGAAVTSGDEIKNLKLAMEQNTYRLRKRLEALNDVVRMERQRILRHKQAMQLLSLWCDRNEFFPGLRPNAGLLRYEPTRSLDDLLSNPLAIEYLKSHCDSDCTLENLFFLLDVSWLQELEAAEDAEQDAAKRKRIHDVAADTAASIIARYIAADAPQQINISAASFDVLRHKGTTYKRDMFKDAVGEVKLMLDTDILPRFQNSTAYTAMSENLYIDSFAYADDSDLSSDSVSTAGSVLIDEAEVGASHMVAFNFKNLYATFDGETDLASTCTNEMSVIDDPVTTTNSTIGGQTGTVLGTVSSSEKEGTRMGTVSSSEREGTGTQTGTRQGTLSSSEKGGFEKDDSSDSEPSDVSDPKDKPAAEKKEAKAESDSSSDSSDNSDSSDLVSSSSSSSSD